MGTTNRAIAATALGAALIMGTLAATADTARADQHDKAASLPGTYTATYPVLFSERGEVATVEKYVTIEAAGKEHLYFYRQCWHVKDSDEWNAEQGGLVVTSDDGEPVEFGIVETGETPVEGSTGFFQGRMTGPDTLDVSYYGLDRGIVFRMALTRTDTSLSEDSCPAER